MKIHLNRIQKNSTFQLFVRRNVNIFIFTHFMDDNMENFSEKIKNLPKIGIFQQKKGIKIKNLNGQFYEEYLEHFLSLSQC